jgi:SAM-dependent methyltransferase
MIKKKTNYKKQDYFISKISLPFLMQYFRGKKSLYRYYQNIFIELHGKNIIGKIIEIGAEVDYHYDNYFPNSAEYHSTNILINSKSYLDVRNMDSIDDNSIDAVVCISVLNHIDLNDIKSCFNEIFRVLKPNGKLIMTLPFGFPICYDIDYWRFGRDSYSKLLSDFSDISLTDLGGTLSTITNTLQRPCGKITPRYFIYKCLGLLFALLTIKFDTPDNFPIGFGIIAKK